jgi:parvulin-like peptidyl-prolyl isomerase
MRWKHFSERIMQYMLTLLLCFVTSSLLADDVPLERVLARIGTQEFTEAMVVEHLERALGSEWRDALNTPEKRNQARADVLEQLVRAHVIEQALSDQNVEISDRDVRAKIAEMRAQLADRGESLESALRQGHSHIWYLERALRGTLALYQLIQNDVDDTQVQHYFIAHREQFPRRRRVRHLLVMTIDSKTREPLDDESLQAAKQRIASVKAELAADGSNFEVLIKRWSDGPRAAKGGELPWIVEGDSKIDPAFSKAVFELKQVGEISRIVRSRYGYHLIQLLDIHEPRWQDARQSCIQAQQEAVMRELLKQANVQRFDPVTGRPIAGPSTEQREPLPK